jgi:hypothetical protein
MREHYRFCKCPACTQNVLKENAEFIPAIRALKGSTCSHCSKNSIGCFGETPLCMVHMNEYDHLDCIARYGFVFYDVLN